MAELISRCAALRADGGEATARPGSMPHARSAATPSDDEVVERALARHYVRVAA